MASQQSRADLMEGSALRRRGFLAGTALTTTTRGLAAPNGEINERGLVFVPRFMPASLDPIATPSFATRTAALAIFETLYGTDARLSAMPQMAEDHRMEENGKAWTIRLRAGLTFHDGTPVTAEDCVVSLRRWMARDRVGRTLAARLEKIQATDRDTMTFRLTKPLRQLPLMLSKSALSPPVIMPARLSATPPDQVVPTYVGSGPFRFDPPSWRAGETFSLVRHAAYKPRDEEANFTGGRRRALVDRITWRAAADPVQAAHEGWADWLEALPPKAPDDAIGDPAFTAGRLNETGYYGILRLNPSNGPTANPGVRQAILAAIDQRAVMEAVFGADSDRFLTPMGLFSAQSPFANEAGTETIDARLSLKTIIGKVRDSGYDGTPLVLLRPAGDPIHDTMMGAISEQLAEIGLKVQDRAIGRLALEAWRHQPDGPGAQTPDGNTWSAFCDSIPWEDQFDPFAAWIGGNPTIAHARDAWLDLANPEDQVAAAAQMQRQVFADAAFAPLGQWMQVSAWRTGMTGLQKGPFPLFWGVSRPNP